MGSASDTFENTLAAYIFQGGFAATLYLALGTAAGESTFTELPNANNYSRTAITMNSTNWPISGTVPGQVSNNLAITTATASGDWGTPTVYSLWTSITYGAGSVVVYGNIDPSAIQDVGSGKAANFAIGTLVGTVD